MGYRTVIVSGLDLSLTSTGIARITWEPGGHIDRHTARVQSKGAETATLKERIARIRDCRRKIVEVVSGSDLVVVEGPSYGSKTSAGHAHDRSGLWHETLDILDDLFGCTLAEVPPRVRAKYATGNGAAGKDAVLAAAIKRYPEWDITGNDVADAVLIAAMGARFIGRPIDKIPQLNMAGMTKVRWPELPVGLGTQP